MGQSEFWGVRHIPFWDGLRDSRLEHMLSIALSTPLLLIL